LPDHLEAAAGLVEQHARLGPRNAADRLRVQAGGGRVEQMADEALAGVLLLGHQQGAVALGVEQFFDGQPVGGQRLHWHFEDVQLAGRGILLPRGA